MSGIPGVFCLSGGGGGIISLDILLHIVYKLLTFSEKIKKIVQVEGRTIVAAAVRVSI